MKPEDCKKISSYQRLKLENEMLAECYWYWRKAFRHLLNHGGAMTKEEMYKYVLQTFIKEPKGGKEE